MRSVIAAAVVLASASASAVAAPGLGLATVDMPAQPHATAATILYLNRCVGGCTIKKGGGDARTHQSDIPDGAAGQDFTLTEYAWGDADWASFMLCMREVYSPYGVTVTDALPTAGEAYNEGIIAGLDSELNLGGVGGIAPVTSDCSPYSYVISFSFANGYGPGNSQFLCAVAAQETGHAFGLDHSYEYADGRSACTDPMSYRGDCGGQRFFRHEAATCGEFQPRACRCGATQNSHLKLLSVLGPATPITAPPVVSITSPAADAQIAAGTTVIAIASAQRGVKVVELFLNGHKWTEAAGAPWGSSGQGEAGYPLALPATVPDGVIDIVVKAKDDIGITTETPVLTVTKGVACTSADTCAEGQRCETGRCFWDPPVGELGDVCTYPEFCKNALCAGTATETRCTQRCLPGAAGTCPDDFECLPDANDGVCWPASAIDDPGCCSSSRGSLAQSGLLALALALVLQRRRR